MGITAAGATAAAVTLAAGAAVYSATRSPSIPKAPPVSPVPQMAHAATQADPQVAATSAAARARAGAAAQNQGGTNPTGPAGLQQKPTTAPATLLGGTSV